MKVHIRGRAEKNARRGQGSQWDSLCSVQICQRGSQLPGKIRLLSFSPHTHTHTLTLHVNTHTHIHYTYIHTYTLHVHTFTHIHYMCTHTHTHTHYMFTHAHTYTTCAHIHIPTYTASARTPHIKFSGVTELWHFASLLPCVYVSGMWAGAVLPKATAWPTSSWSPWVFLPISTSWFTHLGGGQLALGARREDLCHGTAQGTPSES